MRACTRVQESLSALADGEQPLIAEVEARAHLGVCAHCRRFEEALAPLSWILAARSLASPPDNSGAILAALGCDGDTSRLTAAFDRVVRAIRHPRWTGAGQWAAAIIPLAVATPALVLGLGGHDSTAPVHLMSPCTQALIHYMRAP